MLIQSWQMPHTTHASASILLTTALGPRRFTYGHVDTYESGTALERGYMCSCGVISSVFRDDALDATDTVVAALAQVGPSELVRPVPGRDTRTGEATSGVIEEAEIG